jgi:signal transduction histidine kinase
MICQEALNNVTRHSGATECRIDLVCGTDLILEIRDNGQGISPESRPGVGLTSMRQRAEQLGGTVELKSVTGEGTSLTACLPLTLQGE